MKNSFLMTVTTLLTVAIVAVAVGNIEVGEEQHVGHDQNVILDLFKRPYEAIWSRIQKPSDIQPLQDFLKNIPKAASIPTDEVFSHFKDDHQEAAKELIEYFSTAETIDDLKALTNGVRSGIHPELYIYAVSATLMSKPKFRSLRIPSLVEIFPNKFVEAKLLMEAKINAKYMRNTANDEPIIINQQFTATMERPENRLSFFREDYGVNSRHWHWHLVNPFCQGVDRDRKGELFYYMHHEMLGRYNIERITAGLEQVKPMEWRHPIAEGYFSKLSFNNAGQNWGTRQDHTTPRDATRMDVELPISDLETWRDRIQGAIDHGFLVKSNGETVELTDDMDDIPNQHRGIERLGDAIEADCNRSLNFRYYGKVHNMGHNVISSFHDPDGSHKEPLGVMSDVSVAVRDPVFFQHHKFVDNMFDRYKRNQRPYEPDDLQFQGLKITGLNIRSDTEQNKLQTFYNTSVFEAHRGLDFNGYNVKVNITHLDHTPFTYHIEVTNELPVTKTVTVRIFLAPQYNLRNQFLGFMEQRNLWIEMDKFIYNVAPRNTLIEQHSTESSIIGSESKTFASLETQEPSPEEAYPNCGWPPHMLVPKGKPEGMDFQLFVMITDYEKDKVEGSYCEGGDCRNRFSYCGVIHGKYPDKRPMGFPFDRIIIKKKADQTPYTTQDFADEYRNMMIRNITITFDATSNKLSLLKK